MQNDPLGGRADTFPYYMTKENCVCISYRVCEVCDLREAVTVCPGQPELRLGVTVPQAQASSSIFTIVAALRALATLS